MSNQDRISTESESPNLADAITIRIHDPEVVYRLIADGVIDPVVSSPVAAELIGISRGHLRNLRMKGLGPVRRVYPHADFSYGYRLSEVQAYIDSMKPDTATEPDTEAGAESEGGDAA